MRDYTTKLLKKSALSPREARDTNLNVLIIPEISAFTGMDTGVNSTLSLPLCTLFN